MPRVTVIAKLGALKDARCGDGGSAWICPSKVNDSSISAESDDSCAAAKGLVHSLGIGNQPWQVQSARNAE